MNGARFTRGINKHYVRGRETLAQKDLEKKQRKGTVIKDF